MIKFDKVTLPELEQFIVKAKAATYVGNGQTSPSCRAGSHDLRFEEGNFVYLDSYFGGSDFIGQEVVYYAGDPVWAINYYGYILNPQKIVATETGQVIKESLSIMYRKGRFLGGFTHHSAACNATYTDTSQGDVSHCSGTEWITRDGERVYELVYHGGLIKA